MVWHTAKVLNYLDQCEIKAKPGLNCSAVILVIQIPIPSINANKMAPTAADLTAAEGPPKATTSLYISPG